MCSQQPPLRCQTITGVVLAGGRSSRMGKDKALLRVGDDTLVERCLSVLSSCFKQTLVIANQPGIHPQAMPDDVPDLGPIGGLATALRRATTPGIFIVACDMPFLNADLIHEMADGLAGWDAVAIRGEPLHAGYSRKVLPVLERQTAAGDYSVQRLLEQLRVNYLSEAVLSRYPDCPSLLRNVNTPGELEQARAHLRSLR